VSKVKPERIAEARYVKYVRKECKGITRKMNGLGYRSWPDQWSIPPNGNDFLIEFKREGVDPTELQEDMHQQLRSSGKVVYICWTFSQARTAYDLHASSRRYKP
jgi:hypothetical protein